MQILIAEDNVVSAKLLSYLFEPLGNCEVVHDGDEAVELVEFCIDEGTPFNLIVLDLKMPNMDGKEALKTIRGIEAKKKLPEDQRSMVLISSADSSPLDAELEEMYQARLTKPLSKQSVFDALITMGISHPDAE